MQADAARAGVARGDGGLHDRGGGRDDALDRPGRARRPGLAFSEPLPDLSRPSLDAARRLLAVGPKVGGLVAEALDDGG